jgi:quinol monooxygenase YgiN
LSFFSASSPLARATRPSRGGLAIRQQPGFLGASVSVPDDADDRALLEGSWSSAEHFERWRDTPEREELLRGLRHLLAEEPVVDLYHVVDSIG